MSVFTLTKMISSKMGTDELSGSRKFFSNGRGFIEVKLKKHQ